MRKEKSNVNDTKEKNRFIYSAKKLWLNAHFSVQRAAALLLVVAMLIGSADGFIKVRANAETGTPVVKNEVPIPYDGTYADLESGALEDEGNFGDIVGEDNPSYIENTTETANEDALTDKTVEGADFDVVPTGVDITDKFTDKNFLAEVRRIINKPTGAIYDKDVSKITTLNVNYKRISDISGIEYFIELRSLDCGNNNRITKLDTSKNIYLEELYCGDNWISKLDISKNIYLKRLSCTWNALSTLDVSKNIALESLLCYQNSLKTLDISANTNLKTLNCAYNLLTELDMSSNKDLSYLGCRGNKLTKLNISKNKDLEYLECYENQLIELDVSNNIALKHIDCSNNPLMALDISNNTALESLTCADNTLAKLDISNNIVLKQLFCSRNALTKLDISQNTLLARLYCSNNALLTLDISKNTELYYLDCSNNQLTTLDVTKNKWLGKIYCQYNYLPDNISAATGAAERNLPKDDYDYVPQKSSTYKGSFQYASPTKDAEGKERTTDVSETYCYTDNYFRRDSRAVWDSDNKTWKYDNSLATMSLCLELSSWSSSETETINGRIDYAKKSKNAKDLLNQIGFTDFAQSEDYNKRPETDTIGAVAARKTIKADNKDYTLIAVAVRGGGYGAEWGGNFKMGLSGQHEGFDTAKTKVLNFLGKYIKDNNISGDIKLWIVGFSRGAATANLVAGAIDDGYKFANCTLAQKDLYAFCFETPMGALSSHVSNQTPYINIVDIINRNDIVPWVAPKEKSFEFTRYGANVYLPTSGLDKNYKKDKAEMLKQFNALTAIKTSTDNKYIIDDFKMKKVNIIPIANSLPAISVSNDIMNNDKQYKYVATLVEKTAKDVFKSRANYVQTYQADISQALTVLKGADDNQTEKFRSIFSNKINNNIGKIVSLAILFPNNIETYALIEHYAVESLNEAGITAYDTQQFNKGIETLASIIVELAEKHPHLTATLFANMDKIGSAHYPELCLAWLRSRDTNYTNAPIRRFPTGVNRVLRVNCPVDIEVYQGDTLLAAIIADEPQDIEDSDIISSINEDGEKIVYLPAEEEFDIRITATGEGNMTCSLGEYSPNLMDATRIINYYEMPILTGDKFSLSVSDYSDEDFQNGAENGSSAEYILTGDDGQITPDADLTGEDAVQANYYVEVLSESTEKGIVMGSGERTIGSYAQISAIVLEGCTFGGWYVDNIKVSDDSEYRFLVTEDVTLTAKFETIYKKGHVLGKDTITILDLLELLRFIAGKKTLTPQQMEAANITGAPGAKPGINDLLEMLRYLANKPSKLSGENERDYTIDYYYRYDKKEW